MRLFASQERPRGLRRRSFLSRAFPPPTFLIPPSVGIDVSDSTIKWLGLTRTGDSAAVSTYGTFHIGAGIVTRGAIQSVDEFVQELKELKTRIAPVAHVSAALPEEYAYIFSMHVPLESADAQIVRLIEFAFEEHVPIPIDASLYDYDIIGPDGEAGLEISVTVFPREIVEAYVVSFEKAGLTLLSLECEAGSIARAVSTASDNEIELLVDFGMARSSFTVTKRGIPIFSSTVEIGGESLTTLLMNTLSLSAEEVTKFKNTEGLMPRAGKESPAFEAVVGTASALSDEIARHYHYWDTRRNEGGMRVTPIRRVVLFGGSSNLYGLQDYVAARIQAQTETANVWRHVASFDDYIPPIDRLTSLEYATAIGLALRDVR